MKEHIARRSKAAGFEESVLPTFSKEESKRLAGSLDYLGVNMYTSYVAKPINYTSDSLFWQDCIEVDTYQPASWKSSASSWLKVSIV